MRQYKFQLQDRSLGAFAGPSVIADGGKCLVTAAGSTAKATLQNADGSALANPITLVRGSGKFYTANTVEAVDLFIITAEGYAVQLWSVGPDEMHEVPVDRGNHFQTLVIPFNVANQTADNSENDTGLDEVAGMVVLPFPYLRVTAIDAGETVSFGTGEVTPADGGDADGYMSLVALDTLGLVTDVNGALINAITSHVAAGDSFTWTLSAGSDTAAGYIYLPYMLMGTGNPIITQA